MKFRLLIASLLLSNTTMTFAAAPAAHLLVQGNLYNASRMNGGSLCQYVVNTSYESNIRLKVGVSGNSCPNQLYVINYPNKTAAWIAYWSPSSASGFSAYRVGGAVSNDDPWAIKYKEARHVSMDEGNGQVASKPNYSQSETESDGDNPSKATAKLISDVLIKILKKD